MSRLSRSGIENARLAIVLVLLGAALVGCSEHFRDHLYVDRRETISPIAGDSLASNRVTQVVDPWSRASANNNIAYSGEKMQSASERYRTNRVIPPVNPTTSSSSYAQSQQAASTSGASSGASAPSGGAAVK